MTHPIASPAPDATDVYAGALCALRDADVEFLVGGAFAFERHTGIARDTKDLDVFVRPADCARALAGLAGAGYETAVPYPHWLAKARCDGHLVDVIFGSGNGVAIVDDGWFAHAVPAEVLDVPVHLTPVEETIWSKAFIMERERYDGADIAHLLNAHARRLDWNRLLSRFGPHWRVLLSHLVLFGFAYPGQRDAIPAWVMDDLTRRLAREGPPSARERRLCQGTLLSREQYLADLESRGYEDARLAPRGTMTAGDVRRWTAAIPGHASWGRAALDDADRGRR